MISPGMLYKGIKGQKTRSQLAVCDRPVDSQWISIAHWQGQLWNCTKNAFLPGLPAFKLLQGGNYRGVEMDIFCKQLQKYNSVPGYAGKISGERAFFSPPCPLPDSTTQFEFIDGTDRAAALT
jgi:hypothetical protein